MIKFCWWAHSDLGTAVALGARGQLLCLQGGLSLVVSGKRLKQIPWAVSSCLKWSSCKCRSCYSLNFSTYWKYFTCLIFENNASQVCFFFFFSLPAFNKQQRIAEVARLHHVWWPPVFSWAIVSYPTSFPACQRRRGNEGRQKCRPGPPCAAHSCQPQGPASGPPSTMREATAMRKHTLQQSVVLLATEKAHT